MNTNDLLLTVAVELEANARREEREQPADGDGPSALREWARQLRDLAARCDQPAGEPVPLPVPAFKVRPDGEWFEFLRVGGIESDCATSLYTADQLRTHREEYAETVAAPLRDRVAELEQSRAHLGRLADETLERALTAERERDEARRDAERYRWLRGAPLESPSRPCCYSARNDGFWPLGREDLDAAIDSAMVDSIEGKS